MKAAVKVLDELIEAAREGRWPTRQAGQINTVADLVGRWEQTENPHYMDVAQLARIAFEAPETPAFREQLGWATEARLNGAKGTTDAVYREYWKGQAFTVICNLIFHGAQLTEAAEKAAAWVDKKSDGYYSPKRSTLEKQYSEAWRKTGTEKIHHDSWAQHGKASTVEWLEARKKLNWLPTDSQRGKRR